MMEFVTSIVNKVVEYVKREGQYFIFVQNIMNDLKNEKEKLTSERDSLEDRVEQAKDSCKIIEKAVEMWLNDVKNILQVVAYMEQSMEANNNCFQGRCPTFKRYRLCKQMVKKRKEIVELRGQSNIRPFSHPALLPAIQYESSENFVDFESRRGAYHRLMEALQDDSCYMIGVYGMGGSGKTTLVTQVGKKVEQLNLFGMVIWITVSRTPNIKYIQGKITDMINIILEKQSKVERAHKIWRYLQGKERVLVILDDLWRKFELTDIGICLNNDTKGRWKVLVTTRSKQICNSMECQKRIHLDLLDEVESWTLFKKHANIDDDMSCEIKKNVCKECKGVPIAITAVGSSLKGKTNAEWEAALGRLNQSEAIDDLVEEGLRDVYSCLKLSCDYLEDKETELLFLLCYMFPKYYEIPVEDLIRYVIGLGVGGSHPLEWVRSCIQAGINKLLDSSLLSQNHWVKDCVKIHDMVGDVGLKDHKILFNHDKPLGTEVMHRSIEDYFAISSWNKENEISLELDAPNLQILLLVQDMRVKDHLDLSNVTFKERDNKLKVLAILRQYSYREYSLAQLSLPRSVEQWTNLQTVRLNRWDVGDISFITSLTQLEILDLQWCSLNELPIEMGRLEKLKMLDLSHCDFKGKDNGAVGKCLQLEELYAYRCDSNYLSKSIMDIVTHSKLQRFKIGYFFRERPPPGFRAVELREFDISKLRASGRNILQVAEDVLLSDSCIRGCKNVIPDLISVVGGINNLTTLRLADEEEIECIYDATSDSDGQVDSSIPRLVVLTLSHLPSLKELCRGPPQRFFEKLEKLSIYRCRQLHTIFPVECNLQNLNYLNIYECSIGKEVLFSMSVAQSLQQLEHLRIDYLRAERLKHIIGSGSNTTNQLFLAPPVSPFLFPNLKILVVRACWNIESLFPICCCVEGLVQLQEIFLGSLPKLKYVFGECDHIDHSSLQYHNQIMLPSLKKLTLDSLENLIDMCPENYPTKWQSLSKNLIVKDCPKFSRRVRFEAE